MGNTVQTSIYSAFYEFLNKNIYIFRVNEERAVWYYKNMDILRSFLCQVPELNIPVYDFIDTVQLRPITDEILSFFERNKESIIKAVKPIVEATKKAIEHRKRYALSAEYLVDSIVKLKPSDKIATTKHIIFKGYACLLSEDVDYDWNYYAKSYNHPKKTVTAREIWFREKGKPEHTETVALKSFRYNDVVKGFADFFKIPLATKNKFQTNPYFEVTKIKDTAKYTVYTQTFGGEVVGYVISDGKTTYHDDTKKAAVEGWKKKAALAQEKKEIKAGLRFTAAQLHEEYGFCRAGIHEFADACGLDTTKSYTQKELRTAFNKSPERRTLLIKYKSELSQIL